MQQLIFKGTMDKILSSLIGICVFVYIDDIIIFSPTPQQHLKDVDRVFSLLANNGLKLKLSKCTFMKPQVELLGYIISKEGITPNPDKVDAIHQIPPPINVKTLRSFLGSTNLYRPCIPSYAHIAEPLINLTRKDVPFLWSNVHQRAFQQLKNSLASDAIMIRPNPNKPYRLYTDSSSYAVGAVLVQLNDAGDERPSALSVTSIKSNSTTLGHNRTRSLCYCLCFK